MKTTESDCRINGLHITEASIKSPLTQTGVSRAGMEAVYATIEKTETRVYTHGRCTAYQHNWSEQTMKLLRELLVSMESDLTSCHFKIVTGTESTDVAQGIGSGEVEEVDQV